MKKSLTVILAALIVITSCEFFDELDSELGLTNDEIVEGLTEALLIGTDSATSALSLENGYFKGDPVNVKIPLPDDVEKVRGLINQYNQLSSVFNLDSYFDDVIESVNRAAEFAAKGAAPIFEDAIRTMEFTDALDILQGSNPEAKGENLDFDSTAATGYFYERTHVQLTNLFAPEINKALDIDVIGTLSATEAWNALTSQYNNIRGQWAVNLTITGLGLSNDFPSNLNNDLGAYCTEKALDGLFYMVGEEEKKIRKNPFEWASNIIEKVFGSLLEN